MFIYGNKGLAILTLFETLKTNNEFNYLCPGHEAGGSFIGITLYFKSSFSALSISSIQMSHSNVVV